MLFLASHQTMLCVLIQTAPLKDILYNECVTNGFVVWLQQTKQLHGSPVYAAAAEGCDEWVARFYFSEYVGVNFLLKSLQYCVYLSAGVLNIRRVHKRFSWSYSQEHNIRVLSETNARSGLAYVLTWFTCVFLPAAYMKYMNSALGDLLSDFWFIKQNHK